MSGSALGPICADETAVAAPSLVNEQQLLVQQTDSSTNEVKTVNRGPSTLQMAGVCAAIPVVAGLILATQYSALYVFDRSITVAHESGHALATWLAGKTLTKFYVSKELWGDGGMNYAPREAGLKDIAIIFAGPFAGAAAYFAWAKLWEAGRYMFYGDEHKDVNLLAKLGSSTLAACGSLFHLKLNLTPQSFSLYDPRSEAINMMTGCDGEKIRKILTIISPTLGIVYPHVVYFGLLAYAGYSVYRIGQIYRDLHKECGPTTQVRSSDVANSIGNTTPHDHSVVI